MSNNLYNLTYYIGTILFTALLYSLDGFAEIWIVALSLLACSVIAFYVFSRKWENIALLGILISGTGLMLGLILKFFDYVNQHSQLM